jgi:hypothetical protein
VAEVNSSGEIWPHHQLQGEEEGLRQHLIGDEQLMAVGSFLALDLALEGLDLRPLIVSSFIFIL